LKLIFIFFLIILFTGCIQNPKPIRTPPPKQNLNVAYGIKEASERLSYNLLNHTKDIKVKYIAVTTFVNLNNFTEASDFGRLLPEVMLTQLYLHGYNVSDFRTYKGLKIRKKDGEFILTRDTKEMKELLVNDYLLVGTYILDRNLVILNARLVDTIEGKLVSAAQVNIDRDSVEYLLKDQKYIRITGK
jgi:TolB-like protein